MKTSHALAKVVMGLCIGVVSLAACAQSMKVTLTGSQEVPPVMTSASGVGAIMVAPDEPCYHHNKYQREERV